MSRVYGADLIVLRACDGCGEWPYLHKPGCPVALQHEREVWERVVEPIMRAEASARVSPSFADRANPIRKPDSAGG